MSFKWYNYYCQPQQTAVRLSILNKQAKINKSPTGPYFVVVDTRQTAHPAGLFLLPDGVTL